ncbi:MAG: PUR family DNA/RNA-binding protein, partial [Candidatus Shikimatogenerans sp. JK-2022]|nr:PUR family DNA/RNA-binding protein [Candidatus Shikimatogenerans bostrichidophilus]
MIKEEKENKTNYIPKIRKEIYSKILIAKSRRYFFDTNETNAGDYFLTITESKKLFLNDGRSLFKKHKIFIYKEDFEKFQEILSEMIKFIFDKKGKKVLSDYKKDFILKKNNKIKEKIEKKNILKTNNKKEEDKEEEKEKENKKENKEEEKKEDKEEEKEKENKKENKEEEKKEDKEE